MALAGKQRPEAQGPAPAPPLLECALCKDANLVPMLPWTVAESNQHGLTLIWPGTIDKRPVSKVIFEKVMNPYLTEVLQHPQSIKMSEGMLHIHDVEGPKETGRMETTLEAMEQQVFKCQGMVECGLNANLMMITEFTRNHKMDAIDIGKHLSRFEDSGDSFILP
ncbi:40S ribosomal protein S5-1 [Hordeum vulgare]|nr:40S ribosomal protein S5-1 [Hordeum vulgare]